MTQAETAARTVDNTAFPYRFEQGRSSASVPYLIMTDNTRVQYFKCKSFKGFVDIMIYNSPDNLLQSKTLILNGMVKFVAIVLHWENS